MTIPKGAEALSKCPNFKDSESVARDARVAIGQRTKWEEKSKTYFIASFRFDKRARPHRLRHPLRMTGCGDTVTAHGL